ncbi:uncharacterized protein FYW61_020794 isoform 1-T1 [Anableps anableps]
MMGQDWIELDQNGAAAWTLLDPETGQRSQQNIPIHPGLVLVTVILTGGPRPGSVNCAGTADFPINCPRCHLQKLSDVSAIEVLIKGEDDSGQTAEDGQRTGASRTTS